MNTLSLPSLVVRFLQHSSNNDGIIDITEKAELTDVVIELGEGVEVDDILTLTSSTGQIISPITITQAMIEAGEVIFENIEVPQNELDNLEVSATLTDVAGNNGATVRDEATLNTSLSIAPVAQDKTVGMYEDGTNISGETFDPANAVNGDNANLNRPSITIDIDTLQQRDISAFDLYGHDTTTDTYVKLTSSQYSVSVNTDGSYTYQTTDILDNSFGKGNNELVLVEAEKTANSANTVISETIEFEVGYKFSVKDFGFTDANKDELAAVIITSLPTSGQLLLNGVAVAVDQSIPANKIGGLLFVPEADYSGKPTFTFKVQDDGVITKVEEDGVITESGANTSEEATITIDVVAVADGPVVEYTYQTPVTNEFLLDLQGNGVNKTVQNNGLKLNENADYPNNYNFEEPGRVDYMPGVIDTTLLKANPSTIVQDLKVGSFQDYQAIRYDGLIYLAAGEYRFGAKNSAGQVTVDETVVMKVGGQHVLQNEDYATDGTKGYLETPLVVTEAGFYTLDMYYMNYMNYSGPGGLPNLTINGQPLSNSTPGVNLFTNIEAVNAALAGNSISEDFILSNIVGSKDGLNGHYVVTQPNQGESNSWIQLGDLSNQFITIDLLDKTDTAETIVTGQKVILTGLPVGAIIRDGNNDQATNSIEITSNDQQIDITNWARDQIQVFVPPNYVGDKLPINITATSKDVNGDLQQGQTSIIVDINNDSSLYTDTSDNGEANITAGSGNNTMYGGAGADILDGGAGNDVLIGGSGGDVRGGGFEYWDFSSTDWKNVNKSNDGYEWNIMGPTGSEQAANEKLLNMGSWNLGGKQDDYRYDVKYNTIELNKPSKISYSSPGAGSWVLDTTADKNDQLDIWQDIMTAPGETYELTLLVSRSGTSTINILWGEATIGQIEGGSISGIWPNNSLTMYNGFEGKITNNSDGIMSTVTITVKGDMDSAFTELRVQANNQDRIGSTYKEGRVIADISLKPKAEDGDDTLIGGYGDDLIYGQGGDDELWGDLQDESNPNGSIGNDVFVFSMLNNNGNDTIKDFSIADDKLYMIDLLDAFQGTGLYDATNNAHRTRYPGADNDGNTQSTLNSDDNITIEDLLNVQGNTGQYIEVSGNADGDLVLSLTGRGTSKGSVTLEGIKYGKDDNDASTYGSVADLLGANGHEQILYVTTDSFNTGVYNNWDTLTNIQNTPYFGV